MGGLGSDLSTQASTYAPRVLFPPGTWLQHLPKEPASSFPWNLNYTKYMRYYGQQTRCLKVCEVWMTEAVLALGDLERGL